MESPTERSYAQALDRDDPLRSYRNEFLFPRQRTGQPVVYFTGNSLGLQPVETRRYVLRELDKWGSMGVEGHFESPAPWYSYHELFAAPMANIVGAQPHEVAVMNSLTTNLHLLMVSFYRPDSKRYKIVIEKGAFPSDRYAVASQAHFHGFDPKDAVIELAPRDGEATLRNEDIVATLEAEGDSIALVMMAGVNYYTGQVFPMKEITEVAHKLGITVGFDLAHAAGNIPMQLHDWDVDFAAWCTYKYLNSGPGGVAGIFVHDRHKFAPDRPRFSGWWGNDPSTRFSMPDAFVPQEGAGGWQLSNAPILPMASLRASLDLFEQAGFDALQSKSQKLHSYLRTLVAKIPNIPFEPLTPSEEERHGCQLSIRQPDPNQANDMANFLRERGIISDVRNDVIRIAPVPLYNSFEDVWYFYDTLREFCERQ
ncbi:MAG: kynureninase [Deltaproteobacteria bacterium]|nr:MAG: kynureninase [Deltaproteobacteria bacterium]